MAKYRRTDEFVRFCVNQYGSRAIQTVEKTLDGVYGSGAVFTGPLSEPLNWMNQAAFGHERYNYTFVVKKSFGLFNESSGWYDKESCLYSIQTNETDAALVYVRMPVMAHGLSQTMPIIRDTMQIMSKYNVTEAVKIHDLFDTFRSAFDRYIWITLVFFVIAFIVLAKVHVKFRNEHLMRRSTQKWARLKARSIQANLRIHKRMYDDPRLKFMAPRLKQQGAQQMGGVNKREKDTITFIKDNAVYDVLTHLFQVETIDYDLISMRIGSIFLTLLSFWIFTYFSNLMSTDMVLSEEPKLIRSYRDLLERGKIQMVFLAFQDDYKQFEYAPPASVKRELWDRSIKSANGNRDSLFIKADSSGGLVATAVSSIIQTVNVDEKNRVELVAMFSSVATPVARATACHLKATFAYRHSKSDEAFAKIFKPVINVYSRVSQDPDELESLATPLFRSEFKTPLAGRMKKRLTNLFEVGTFQYVLEKVLSKSAVSIRQIESPDEADVFRQCMSDNIKDNMKQSELIALKPEQCISLLYACSGTVLLALIVLCYEGWKCRN